MSQSIVFQIALIAIFCVNVLNGKTLGTITGTKTEVDRFVEFFITFPSISSSPTYTLNYDIVAVSKSHPGHRYHTLSRKESQIVQSHGEATVLTTVILPHGSRVAKLIDNLRVLDEQDNLLYTLDMDDFEWT
eukprot:Awhi_evm1s13948